MSVLLTSRQSRGSPESIALLLPLAESMSSPPEAAPQGVSVNVYLQAYMHLLQGLCAPGFKALLSPADQELADFLAGSVCDSPAFVAFSRLVLRKADWIRFDRGDIDKYLRPFRPWASGAAGEDAGEQAEEQGGEDMVEEDAGGDPLAADDGAAAQRADSSEDPLPAPPVDTAALMASLEALQLVDLITTTSISSSSSEESIFDAIASCLSSEELKGVYRKMDKTVLKAQRKEKVLQLLRKQCKSQRSISGFFAKPGGATGSSNSSRLLRAISEVLLKTSSSGSSGSSSSSGSSNGVLFFRVKPSVLLLLRRAQRLQQLSSSYSTEGCSVYAQVASNLDLLVRFKKLAFPQYEVLLTQPLFPSRRLFEQWELSMEIKFALLCLLPPSGAGGHGSILFSLREKVELKNMFQCFSDVFKSAAFNKFVGVRFDDLDQVAAHTAAKAASGGGGGALGLDEHSSALAQEYLFVLSIVAFISFSMELDAAGAGSAKDRPHVFAQFEAGAALADTLCTVAATLEARKSYSYAVHVYLLLLDRGYFKHRRGSWYTRLSIDLEHQGLLESSLAAVQRGLSDGRVKPADRLTLQKRLQNTLAKIRRRAAKELTAGVEGASKGCSSDLFDSHLSGLVDAVNEHIAACLAMAASGASSSSSRAAHTGLCLDCTYQNAPSATSCELCCGASFRLAEEAPKGEPVIVIIDDDDDGGSGDLFMGVAADDGKENCRVDEDAVLAEADSAECFVEQLLSHDRAPPASARTVTISGRRFGDNRVGKNRFLSDSDSVLTVEAYVLEKCLHVDADESEEFRAAVRGGGWGGWHCEGSPLRGLFNLLMWDCLYSTVPNVFVNPYQEAPLDLSTPAFYSNRKSIVDERVSAIAAASQDELLAFVAAAYTTHYKEKTLCVSWKHQLKVLQLIAMCVGAATMAQLCKVFCRNYKQFRSGLPDLLLVRVTDINGSPVDLADLLGDEWESLTFSIFEPVRKRSRGGLADGDELIAPPPGRRRYSRGGFGTVKTAAAAAAAAADGYDEFNDRPQEREAALRAAKESRRAEIQAREQRMRAELSPECLLRAHTFECMSVEVKGPNDHLADKQELWLRALCGVGLESIVVKVKEDFRTLRGIIT